MKLLIEGYASTTDLDRGNGIVSKDALKDYIDNYMKDGGVLLYEHDTTIVGGKVNEVIFDDVGLYIKGEVFDTFAYYNEVKQGAIKGLSVGFKVIDKTITPDGTIVYTKGDLIEISITPVPKNPNCIFTITGEIGDTDIMPDEVNSESVREDKENIIEIVKNVIEIDEIEKKSQDVSDAGISIVDKNINIIENSNNKEMKTMENIEKVEVLENNTKGVEIELKSVNTLDASPQFKGTTITDPFDGVSGGKLYALPRVQTQMKSATVITPVFGMANVVKGEVINQDSSVGTNKIVLNAETYSARYPISDLLYESGGGVVLTDNLKSNIKNSIGEYFDLDVWNTYLSPKCVTTFAFGTSNLKKFMKAVIENGGKLFTNPADIAYVVNTKAYAWLVDQDELYPTTDQSLIQKGVVDTLFGSPVFVVPTSENTEKIAVVNRNYIGSGWFGQEKYKVIDGADGSVIVLGILNLAFGMDSEGNGVIGFTA